MIFMFDMIAHRLFIGSVQCLCASCICILCLYSVFFHLLFLFYSTILLPYFPVFFLCIHACTPMCATSSLAIRLEVSILGGPYIFGGPYLFGDLHLFGGVFDRLGLDHPDTSIPAASKMVPLIFRDQNYVSSAIHFVCVYTPCLYTRYT
jgi:hypothetical protein